MCYEDAASSKLELKTAHFMPRQRVIDLALSLALSSDIHIVISQRCEEKCAYSASCHASCAALTY
jgi:hypothetical protein